MLSDDKYAYYSIFLSNNDIGKHSLGVQLYLNFLKSAFIIFFLMSLCVVPALWNNYKGEGVKYDKKSINLFYLLNKFFKKLSESDINLPTDRFTLANQPLSPSKSMNSSIVELVEYQNEMEMNLFIITFSDLGYSVLFLLYVWYLRVSKNRQVEKYHKENVLVTDFAIEVNGFPEY
jgi:hypothetical protein